ncbi:MAG: hypothetical protein B7C24_03660 [Bacteroidetes bacterium 4572_77]|nr:MAG: hypothetical protein B7C24_03660 [Bacteroidetes bacterium 4572_77]
MKKYFISSLVLAFIASAAFFYHSHSNQDARALFQEKIEKDIRLLKGDMPTKEVKEKALGQPNMAALQDYYATLDPESMRVPQERLLKARNYMNTLNANKSRSLLEWENIPSDMGGRTRSLMWDPNSTEGNKVWAGSVTGGIWYNNNIEEEYSPWVAVDDFMSSLSVSSLCYDPNNTQTFYAGTGEAQTAIITYRESSGRGIGIWKSEDGGESWNLLPSTSDFAYITDVKVRNEAGVSVIYAGVASGKYMGEDHPNQANDGLYRSTDGGASWTQVLPNISDLDIPYTPAGINIASDGRIFVGSMRNINGDGGACLMFSDDGLAGSWTVNEDYKNQIEAGMGEYYLPGRAMIASAPSNENIVYAIIGAGYNNGFGYYKGNFVLKSTDNGVSWNEMNIPNNDPAWASLSWHAFSIAVDPNDADHFYIGGLDQYHSLDGGNSYKHVSDWAQMYYGGGDDYIHADQHIILFKPNSSEEIIFGSDGGVFYTSQGTNNYPDFLERNHLYSTLQFYTAAIHPEEGEDEKQLGGLQDNGTLLFSGNPLNINDMVSGGDGAYCFYDKNEDDISITSYYYNRYTIFLDGSWYNSLGDDATGTFVCAADYDYELNMLFANGVGFFGQDANTIFRGTGIPNNPSSLLISTGTSINTWFSSLTYSPFSPPGNATLFAGSQAGHLFKMENCIASPISQNIGSDDFPTANISCLAIGGSEDTLLVSFSNYGVSSLWQTYNGGETWQEKEGNLPDMPVRWVIYHPKKSTQALIATELGVWSCSNLTAENPVWEPDNQGLANVRVDMLRIREDDFEVVAASHGRGLFTCTYNYNTVGLSEDLENSAIKIGPNPSYGSITIQLEKENKESKLLKIYNIEGKIVYTETFVDNKKTIDLSALAKGVYVVNLESNNSHINKKISLK